jgi:hypothetical protein
MERHSPPPVTTRTASEHLTGLRRSFDERHLARWRGHALARIGDPRAVPVLVRALRVHNTEYTRAEAALRVDLVFAHLAAGDVDSATALSHDAITIADTVGSLRQRGRLSNVAPLLEVE